MTQYLVPAAEIRCEITLLNSRFIATLAPAITVNEARAFISRVRQEYPDHETQRFWLI